MLMTETEKRSAQIRVSNFEIAVLAKMTTGMSRQKAISAVTREQPELHSNYLEGFNSLQRERAEQQARLRSGKLL